MTMNIVELEPSIVEFIVAKGEHEEVEESILPDDDDDLCDSDYDSQNPHRQPNPCLSQQSQSQLTNSCNNDNNEDETIRATRAEDEEENCQMILSDLLNDDGDDGQEVDNDNNEEPDNVAVNVVTTTTTTRPSTMRPSVSIVVAPVNGWILGQFGRIEAPRPRILRVSKKHECPVCHVVLSTLVERKRHELTHGHGQGATPATKTLTTTTGPTRDESGQVHGQDQGHEEMNCESEMILPDLPDQDDDDDAELVAEGPIRILPPLALARTGVPIVVPMRSRSTRSHPCSHCDNTFTTLLDLNCHQLQSHGHLRVRATSTDSAVFLEPSPPQSQPPSYVENWVEEMYEDAEAMPEVLPPLPKQRLLLCRKSSAAAARTGSTRRRALPAKAPIEEIVLSSGDDENSDNDNFGDDDDCQIMDFEEDDHLPTSTSSSKTKSSDLDADSDKVNAVPTPKLKPLTEPRNPELTNTDIDTDTATTTTNVASDHEKLDSEMEMQTDLGDLDLDPDASDFGDIDVDRDLATETKPALPPPNPKLKRRARRGRKTRLGNRRNPARICCQLCPATFRSTAGLNQHVRQKHVQDPRYKCRKCDLKFVCTTKRRRHEDTGHRDRLGYVDSSTSGSATASGTRTGTGSDSKSLPSLKPRNMLLCSECGKAFPTPHRLALHSVTHSTAPPEFLCDQCPAKFKRKGTLALHLLSHGEKQFKCRHGDGGCDKRFALAATRKSHELTHDAVRPRPFLCEICSKTFLKSWALASHKMTHDDGLKPHKCEHCGATYAQSSNLKYHVLSKHAKMEDRKYPCPVCPEVANKRFVRQFDLDVHLRETHAPKIKTGSSREERDQELVLKCDLCHYRFRTKIQLKSHQKIKHGRLDELPGLVPVPVLVPAGRTTATEAGSGSAAQELNSKD